MTHEAVTEDAVIDSRETELLDRVPDQLFIGGEWRAASEDKQLRVFDPATGRVVKRIADASPADGKAAMDAAAEAFPAWAATPARERAELLRRAFDLLQERKEEFALLMTIEMGKPLAEARGEVAYGGEFLRWFSEETARIQGRYGANPEGTGRMIVSQHPVGPCFLITPWNFPLAMATRKIAPGARRRLHGRHQARRADSADHPVLREAARGRRPAEGRRERVHDLDLRRGVGADHPRPAPAQALLHRLDARWVSGCSSRLRTACCARRWSSAATPRSSCSTTPTSTRRSTGRSWRSSATSARPAPPRTGSSCTAPSPTSSPAASPSACRASRWAAAPRRAS